MAKILHGEDYVKRKKAQMYSVKTLTADESYQLAVEEALEQHNEMARLRALQSYEIAKARRRNKIKSKKYHRLLRREKIKKQMEEFEQLKQTNPELALEKLEAYGRPMQRQSTATAHLFLNEPLKTSFIGRLFSTHPPLQDRIARLRGNVARM